MQNRVGFIVLLIIVLFFGMQVGGYLEIYNHQHNNWNFFHFRFIELLRLFVMLFIGYYVAYWISIKTNKLHKHKDLCLELITEGIKLLSEQKKITLLFMDEPGGKEDKKDARLVHSGFKRISNKIYIIENICSKLSKKKDEADKAIKKLNDDFSELKMFFSDNYYTGFTGDDQKELIRKFDKFEKLFDDLRIIILL